MLQGSIADARLGIEFVERGQTVLAATGLGGASAYMAEEFMAHRMKKAAANTKQRKKSKANKPKNAKAVIDRPTGLEKLAWKVPDSSDPALCVPLVTEDGTNSISRDIARLNKRFADKSMLKFELEDGVSSSERIQLVNAWEEYTLYEYNCRRQLWLSLVLEFAKVAIHLVTVLGAIYFTQLDLDECANLLACCMQMSHRNITHLKVNICSVW